ncbi:Uncharacterised protein [Staphylococcus gallinarum]|uniref:Uncharacterized protein n=1 Tax=Staphylococcus gallinarum TaxID=1293 RepID=A0A380FP73_STAGA|nr:Uncharacterised protein [Staphylococcus gallinarum]
MNNLISLLVKKFETIKEDPKQQFTEIIKLANHFVTEYKEVDSNILNIAMPGPCDYTQGLFLNPPKLTTIQSI